MDNRDVSSGVTVVDGAGANTGLIINEALQHLEKTAGVESAATSIGCVEVRVSRSALLGLMQTLKSDPRFLCKLLLDVTVVDWFDSDVGAKMPTAQKAGAATEQNRFDVVYHVYSVEKKLRVRVKVGVPESDPQVSSITSVWAGANFLEREAWDMYGVNFTGHPDQRRILMYDEFQGHPLRKDYPVQGKQPRIPMRSPEVRNTALDLRRPDLVQISSRKSA